MPPFLALLPEFLSSKLGQYAAIALAAFLALAGLYWKGHDDGYTASDAAHVAAAAAEAKREDKADVRVAADSQARTAEDKRADDANASHVDAAVEKIKAEPPMPPMPTETVTVTGPATKMEMTDAVPPEPAFADAVCVPADVADELRGIR